jgi:phospholipase/lecithinase/hemolysin
MHPVRTILVLGLLATGCSRDGAPPLPEDAAEPPAPAEQTPPAAPPPSALFVLGDSLSDIGNAAAIADFVLDLVIDPPTVGLCHPHDVLVVPRRCSDLYYRQSRVSDGPVAVEHLARSFDLPELEPSLHLVPNRPAEGTVYAVASAKARGTDREDLVAQVDWLLLDHAPLPHDAVYVLMIGGNDAIDALQADVAAPAALPRPSAAIVSAAVAAIRANAERMFDFGARRLVVANVPDLASLPAVRSAARASGDEAAMLASARAISVAFDRELQRMLEALEDDGRWLVPSPPTILRFDLRAALATAQRAIAAVNGNSLDACFDSELYRSSPAAERRFHPGCAPAATDDAQFAAFAFWDGIHPTGTAHAIVGSALSAAF